MTSPLTTRARELSLACCTLIMFGLLLAVLPPCALAQDGSGNQTDRQRAMQLFEQSKFTEVLPLLEKLAAANPSDVLVMERLGWATLVVAGSMKDPQARQQARERARKALLRAKELGDKSDLLRVGLEQLSNPDPADAAFSSNKEADAAMREGEEAHTRGDLDKAIIAYQRALQLDPKLYMAALFTGDMYFKKGYNESDPAAREAQMQKAGEWFARAIAIEPNSETAYRYWGDALMSVNKMTEARDKYIDAIIAEPYNRNSYMGLVQWAQKNGFNLGHPKIEQPAPTMKSSTDKNQTTITMDPKALDPKQGTAYYWSMYDLMRSTYPTASFAKDHPGEKEYRHSLKEEAAALRVVAEVASKDLKSGKLKPGDPSLDNLVKLEDAGLLEAYILFARPDQGIAQDYETYRQTNRNLLQRYWTAVVIAK